MRIRRKPWARPELEASNLFIVFPKKCKGIWHKKFNNESRPLCLELGCGKGAFLSKLAVKNPNCNYIGLDIKDEMLVLTKRNIEKEYNDKMLPMSNVLITAYDISRISDIFDDKDVVDKIYINFCNPWPRTKHKKRRLTHIRQLSQYRHFLKPGGKIYFKTDDDELFLESKNYFKECRFNIIYETYNTSGLKLEDNIETEHELMFKLAGKTIKFLIAERSLN